VVSEKFLIKVTIRSGFSRTVLYFWVLSWISQGRGLEVFDHLVENVHLSQYHSTLTFHIFSVTVRFKGKISKNGALQRQSYYWMLIESHRLAIEWYQFRWTWVTDFKIAIFFEIKYVKNGARQSDSYYWTL